MLASNIDIIEIMFLLLLLFVVVVEPWHENSASQIQLSLFSVG